MNPKHFIKTSTPFTPEAKAWVLEKLHGRFSTYNKNDNTVFSGAVYPSFEDPKEAVFYELTWG